MGGVTDQAPCMSNSLRRWPPKAGLHGGRHAKQEIELPFSTPAQHDLAMRNGAERFVVLGHSFGGAVAVQAAGTFLHLVAGVLTYATQSAGCEEAARMGDTPLLLLHGEHDQSSGRRTR